MTLVILAAGMGSRYGGLKQLDSMTDKGEVLLDFSVYDARLAGFDRVVFIIKEENYDLFREVVGRRMERAIEVRYAFQTPRKGVPAGGDAPHVPELRCLPGARPLGTGHAVLCAEDAVDGDLFAVINADDFYGRDAYFKLASFLQSPGGQAPAGQDPGKTRESSHTRESSPAGNPPTFAMAGYILEKTLTDSGSVSRGLCTLSPEGTLLSIRERTKIYRLPTPGREVVYEEDGVRTPTDPNGIVSMNCWAFTPAVFPLLRRGFSDFLTGLSAGESGMNPEKAEFYLPLCVDDAMRRGDCAVRVLKTHAEWFGVTYPEDKPKVKANLRGLIAAGVYPDGLWD